jgi:hypothetical protein
MKAAQEERIHAAASIMREAAGNITDIDELHAVVLSELVGARCVLLE